MTEPEQIVAAALAAASVRDDLAGVRVAVSAGGTREPIDPVRFLGNRSSGKQGIAVALAAADRGAEVVLVAAHTDDGVLAAASAHSRIRVERVGTAAELAVAMTDAAAESDVVVMVAAVADYRPAEVAARKLTKEAAAAPGMTLHLVETEDVLARLVQQRRAGQTIVGFAAETPADGEDLLERGRRKAARKGVDLLAINEVGWERGFETDANALHVIDAAGELVADARGTKREVADRLWDSVLELRSGI